MPKHDPMSAKAIGNRQKSVGLQRLRWYCQMCQKQCRDENGFKCHTMSESHLRQMRVFAENPNSVLDEFSQEFERGYLETLNQLHGTKRVKANKVYQEYIADKHHIHMNATVWTTLTGFCMHLGKESKAIVDETEKGWFIQYIDRDPKVLARQAQSEQRQKFELDEEERRKREIAAQVQAAEERRLNNGDETDATVDNSLVRDDNDHKIAVALTANPTVSLGLKKRPIAALGFVQDSDEEDDRGASAGTNSATATAGAPPAGAISSTASRSVTQGARPGANGGVLAMMIQEDEQRKLKQQSQHKPSESATEERGYSNSRLSEAPKNTTSSQSDEGSAKHHDSKASSSSSHTKSGTPESWLYKNLVVKVVNKHIARGRIYKQKGRVVRLLGKHYDEAEVEVEGERFDLKLEDLETVIPKVGQSLLVLRGAAKGCEAELLAIHEDKYCCDVRVTQRSSELCGKELRGLEYEHVCKYSP